MREKGLGLFVCLLSIAAICVGCGASVGDPTEDGIKPDVYVLYDPANIETGGLSDMDLNVSLAVSGALTSYASVENKSESVTLIVKPISIVDVDPVQAPWCGHCGSDVYDASATSVTKDLSTIFEPIPIKVVIDPIVDVGDIQAPWCGHCVNPLTKSLDIVPLAVRVTVLPVVDDASAPWCGHCNTPLDFVLTPDSISTSTNKGLTSISTSPLSSTLTPVISESEVLAPWCGHCTSPIDIIVAPGDLITGSSISKSIDGNVEMIEVGYDVAPL